MSLYKAVIAGTGSYLPEKILTNDDMARFVDTSDDWITERTGIKSRRFAADNQYTSDLGTEAAKKALEAAGISAQDIDLIVVATTTPDYTFPSTATVIQGKLGCTNAFAYDVAGVCSGYLAALNCANNAIAIGQSKTALVIGAETMSRIMDMKDRRTCILFGDGAGAVVLKAEKDSGDNGVQGVYLKSDGRCRDILYTSGGPSLNGQAGHILMEGQDVFKHAVTKLVASAKDVLKKHNLSADDIDWLIPHQANIRIIQSVAQKLKLPMEKVIATVDYHANTSAASIPLALDTGIRTGQVKRGDLILHEAIGGGLVWGSALVRY